MKGNLGKDSIPTRSTIWPGEWRGGEGVGRISEGAMLRVLTLIDVEYHILKPEDAIV